jgi:hypothetical protein
MKATNLIQWGALETLASGVLWIAGCRCQSWSVYTQTHPERSE